nr:uncharacterized protein LOC127329246 [Lolium perenne]
MNSAYTRLSTSGKLSSDHGHPNLHATVFAAADLHALTVLSAVIARSRRHESRSDTAGRQSYSQVPPPSPVAAGAPATLTTPATSADAVNLVASTSFLKRRRVGTQVVPQVGVAATGVVLTVLGRAKGVAAAKATTEPKTYRAKSKTSAPKRKKSKTTTSRGGPVPLPTPLPDPSPLAGANADDA